MIENIAYYIFILYWVLISFNGDFIKASVGGVNLFYLILGVGLINFFSGKFRIGYYHLKADVLENSEIDEYGKRFSRSLKFFIIWTLIYIVLSFAKVFLFFNIEGLDYKASYIIRQAYFVFAIPVAYTLAEAALNGKILQFLSSKLTYIVYFGLLIGWLNGLLTISSRALFIGLGSFFFMRKRNLWNFLLMAASLVLSTMGQSAPVIGSIVLLIIALAPGLISRISSKNFNLKFYFLFFALGTIAIIAWDQLYSMISSDLNALWRLQYWLNEARIFIKTYGMGTGFGTAYATKSIFDETINANAFVLSEGIDYVDVLFVTAQHNSLINMFYRLGIVGGLAFVNMNLNVTNWFAKQISDDKTKDEKNQILIWAYANFLYNLVIILLNPGIESPKFFWGYLCFFGILVGLLMRQKRDAGGSNKAPD